MVKLFVTLSTVHLANLVQLDAREMKPMSFDGYLFTCLYLDITLQL